MQLVVLRRTCFIYGTHSRETKNLYLATKLQCNELIRLTIKRVSLFPLLLDLPNRRFYSSFNPHKLRAGIHLPGRSSQVTLNLEPVEPAEKIELRN